MEIIKTIKDQDVGSNVPIPSKYDERKAARAVVFDSEGNIAMLHSTVNHYHKLPGGGVEEAEDVLEGLRREIKEEIGCDVEEIRELGITEEFKNKKGIHQLSYCYTAKVTGEKGEPTPTEKEKKENYEIVWIDMDEAIKILESENGQGHEFTNARDIFILKESKNNAIK